MEKPSSVVFIENTPADPVEMFSNLITAYKTANPNEGYIPMNVATIDEFESSDRAHSKFCKWQELGKTLNEMGAAHKDASQWKKYWRDQNKYGVLNRTMVYKSLGDGHITFTTENNSIKYANLIKDPRISVIFVFNIMQSNGINSLWQVRVIGKAIELSPEQISNLWADEPVYAKVRSRISVCGEPVDFAKHKNAYDKLLMEYENGRDSLPQSEVYTGFKIIPTVWDFYKSEPNCVADRVQYRKSDDEKWSIVHVAS